MFGECGSLEKINMKFNMKKCERIESMFEGCRKLTSVDLSEVNPEKIEKYERLVCDCDSLMDFKPIPRLGVDLATSVRSKGLANVIDDIRDDVWDIYAP